MRSSLLLASLLTALLLSPLPGLIGCAKTPAEAAERPADPRNADAWFAGGRAAVGRAAPLVAHEPAARNVILFVGDGMGISTVTAARILEGQLRGEPGEGNLLAFEMLPHVALSRTYNSDAQVPDSASTMTAMVSGLKTKTGVLGVDERVRRGDHSSVEPTRVLTILEEAELRGLATGVVSTATITHATPAACYAHAPFRFWEDDSRMSPAAREEGFPDIARQLVELPFGDGLEVALGGGRRHFRPREAADPEEAGQSGGRLDGVDLTEVWRQSRPASAYVWNREQLESLDLDATRHLLGLFEPGHMRFETDRGQDAAGEPSLAQMTAIAIEILARNDAGFFLMVEAGRIDHGHHVNNAARALADTIALSDAVQVALEKTDPRETLVVVTADHSHTLTISGYPKRGNPILGKVVGTNWFGDGEDQLGRDALGLPYTTLSYANGPGYAGASADQVEGVHRFGHLPCESRPPFACSFEGITHGRPDLSDIDTEDPSFLQEATVPMGSETHTGEDVPIYAGGARAALFHGVREQHYIYHAMVEAFGWTQGGVPVDGPPGAPAPETRIGAD
ncbi:MAG: alkaline phosphatase [Deltaproteobacteria bacterium]|jgi:alkaline phosphatase|nr:alkaline phosphatase [Deltaproteobacteria bacterium]